MYIPNYDAVLVPASADFQPHSLPTSVNTANQRPLQPLQPPRRRRPLLAILKLLQGRYNLVPEDIALLAGHSATEMVKADEVQEENSESLTKQSSPESGSDEEQDRDRTRVSVITSQDFDDQFETPTLKKAAPSPGIYPFLDFLTKDIPEANDGFSYAYKYRVPHKANKLEEVEVSVQQRINSFPDVVDPLNNRDFQAAFEEKKQQGSSAFKDSKKEGLHPTYLNAPGPYGPLLLTSYLEGKSTEEAKHKADVETGSSVVIAAVPNDPNKPTQLVLRPVAKAVAGPRGVAVASPIAKAVLRRGQKVSLEFDPDAVAIAGPGGRAHAHPQFSIDYVESKESTEE